MADAWCVLSWLGRGPMLAGSAAGCLKKASCRAGLSRLRRQNCADLPVQVVDVCQRSLESADLGLVSAEGYLFCILEIDPEPHQITLHDLLVHCPADIADNGIGHLLPQKPRLGSEPA